MAGRITYTLGIETSCDETSAAVVKHGRVLSCETVSSVRKHARYGGVIPEIATRMHAQTVDLVVSSALDNAGITADDVGLVAMTRGPGLIGSLLVGICFAKAFAYARSIPLIAVDHLHAHVFSAFLDRDDIPLPFIGLVVSGGHTQLYMVNNFTDMHVIGRTGDDAAGEAMDKVGRFYGLGYPAGPHIDRLYDPQKVEPGLFAMRAPGKYDFSFSGIKTKAVYMLRQAQAAGSENAIDRQAVLSSFQYGIIEEIIKKLTKAVEEFKITHVACGGGVAANSYLRRRLEDVSRDFSVDIIVAEKRYCGDNAAMVAGLGEYLYRKGITTSLDAAPCVR